MGDNGGASEHALLAVSVAVAQSVNNKMYISNYLYLQLLILIQKAGASEHASDNSVRWPIVDSASAPGH